MRRFVTPLAAVLWAALLGACAPASGDDVPCNDDGDCLGAQVCVGGLCRAGGSIARRDAGPGGVDAGSDPRDAGSAFDGGPLLDAGPSSTDAGASSPDAGSWLQDGGAGDGGEDDAGPLDAGYDAGLPDGCALVFATDGERYVACSSLSSRANAQQSCEAMGLTLVEIEDESENAFVATLRQGLGASAWIGATDLLVEGVFAWSSGAPLTFQKFALLEPNDLSGEDCVEMWADGTWNDKPCSALGPYICGEPSEELDDAPPYCLLHPSICKCHTVVFEGSVYTLCPEARSFDDAVEACAAHRMAPVKVETSSEGSFLTREAALFETSFWIGLGDPDGDDVHTWRDGSVENTQLYANEPEAGTCGVATSGGFVPIACSSSAGYACEHVAQASLPPDCATAQAPYVACSTPRSFYEARAVCQAAGLDLMVIDDDTENDLALEQLLDSGGLWIGASGRIGTGLVRSVTGALPTFSDFSYHEPNGARADLRCVELHSETWQWSDSSCANQRAFVCEPVDALPPLAASGALCLSQPGACPCERRVVDGILYALCPMPGTWFDAERTCAVLGMQLLEPKVQSHDDLLRGWLNVLPEWTGTWTGLTDRDTEGTFVGPAGNAPSFTSWGLGQPNDENGQDCLGYSQDLGNLWDDLSCYSQQKIACQAPIPAGVQCFDFDGDGYGAGCALGPDCDEIDPDVNPSARDICNGKDDDCSGAVDDDPLSCPCVQVGSPADGEYLVCDRPLTWVAARNMCLAFSAQLAIADDAEESDAIDQHLSLSGFSGVWLGGHDRNVEGTYETSQDVPLPFARWDVNQPDGLDSEDCVEWHLAGWHDGACTNPFPFMCER